MLVKASLFGESLIWLRDPCFDSSMPPKIRKGLKTRLVTWPEVTESPNPTSESDENEDLSQPKKMKLVTDLDHEQEENMVQWLENHPIVYNKKLAE